MILRSWLATLLGRIATSNAARPTLRRRLHQTTTPQDVETLESRRMLTFTLNQAGFNFNLAEETSVYPYPNWSEPATTAVTSVNWLDTNTHTVNNATIPAYHSARTPSLAGQHPDLAGGADGKAFRISPSGAITINNPADIDADVNPSFTLQITDIDDQNGVATTGSITITLIAIGPMQPVIPQFPYFNNTFTNFPSSTDTLGPTEIDNDIATETGDDPSSNSNFPTIVARLPSDRQRYYESAESQGKQPCRNSGRNRDRRYSRQQ